MDYEAAIHQIRTHLVFEVRFLIYAAARFAENNATDPMVALLDSAAVHARNLFEFAYEKKGTFTLTALGGTATADGPWLAWANKRVVHMLEREDPRSNYPDGIDARDPRRLMELADTVLVCLRTGGATVGPPSVKAVFDDVIAAAQRYYDDPSEANHQALAVLDGVSVRPVRGEGWHTSVTDLGGTGGRLSP